MHADLVCPAGFNKHFCQRETWKTFGNAVKSERGFTVFDDRHFARNNRMLANGLVNFPFFMVQFAVDQRIIEFVGRVVLKLHGKVAVRFGRTGETQNAARFAVEAVHYKYLPVTFFERAEQAVLVAGPVGNGKEAGGFVHDEEVLVFVQQFVFQGFISLENCLIRRR